MPEKRTIRDITIEHRQRPAVRRASTTKSASTQKSTSTTKSSPTRRSRKPSARVRAGRRERRTMWSITLLILAIAAIFVATVFGKSTVVIVPEQQAREIDLALTAVREAAEGDLRFDLMVLEDEVSETVAATDAQQVERKASGQIIVFNETSKSQNLREETRFESPEGLIFKTAAGNGITVPAASGGTPGQLEVTIYADEPGAEYNLGLTDFVIPGWREINDSRFETQYARSKTEMTGGFVGTERTVDEAEKARVESALKTALEQRLLISAEAQKTDRFVFFDDGVVLEIADIEQGTGDDSSVDLVQEGVLTAILFNKEELSKIVAAQAMESYAGEPIMITNFDELEFTLTEKETFSANETERISITLAGMPHFEWLISKDELKEQLGGVHKKSFSDIIQQFSGVKRAELSIRPFWKTKIADNPENIAIQLIDSKL